MCCQITHGMRNTQRRIWIEDELIRQNHRVAIMGMAKPHYPLVTGDLNGYIETDGTTLYSKERKVLIACKCSMLS